MLASSRSAMLVSTFVLLLAVAFLAWFFLHPVTPMPTAQLKTSQIEIGSSTLHVEVADTDAAREQGLSDRTALAPNSGMLFVFQQDGDWGFWMKDMNFALDIIFISATQTPGVGSVVSVAANASPASYNASNPNSSQVFYPPLAVRYVLEVPAGFAAAHNIGLDTKVVLQ